MRNKLINLIVFAAGMAVGALISKKVYEGYYANLAEEEIESVKKHFGNPRLRPTQEVNDDEYAVKPAGGRLVNPNPYEQAKMNYRLHSTLSAVGDNEVEPETDEGDLDDSDDPFLNQPDPEDANYPEPLPPYIIPADEYLEKNDRYDKVSLYYYIDDGVLCEDGHDDAPLDIKETIGEEAVDMLLRRSAVWVRNEHFNIDYEVLCIKGSYKDSIDTPPLSPAEKYKKRAK